MNPIQTCSPSSRPGQFYDLADLFIFPFNIIKVRAKASADRQPTVSPDPEEAGPSQQLVLPSERPHDVDTDPTFTAAQKSAIR